MIPPALRTIEINVGYNKYLGHFVCRMPRYSAYEVLLLRCLQIPALLPSDCRPNLSPLPVEVVLQVLYY